VALIRQITNINQDKSGYPFSIKSFQNLKSLDLENDIVILIGDNGSGKSSLLEIIATKLNLYRISNDLNYKDIEFAEITESTSGFEITYQVKPKGFFFRSEDFITYIKFLDQAKLEAENELKRIDNEFKNKSSYSKSLAKMPHYRTINDIDGMYNSKLNELSHGESYLDFFKSRLKPNSLYILDEAEMPLSISNQLALMLMIKEAIEMGCQFIIATHSPVLMSYPNSLIYQIDDDGFKKTTYEEIESVNLLKDFLKHKDRYLNYLFK
jgi:predicted ATPase